MCIRDSSSAIGAVGAAPHTSEAMGAEEPVAATVATGDMDVIDLPAAEKELPVRRTLEPM